MKFYLLSVKELNVNNIGDYIQALASAQYLPHIDGFINREQVSSYSGDKCAVIMNGWFMHHPENWPPSKMIIPHFVAFHINSSASQKMLSDAGIAYLKEHEPIGCRDLYTMELLKKYGVKAYFSSCLTLTLGRTYYSETRGEKVYFVDPIIPKKRSLFLIFKDISWGILHVHDVCRTSRSLYGSTNIIKRIILSARFWRLYSRCFTKDVLRKAIFIKQESSYYTSHFPDDYARLHEAERLVRLYSQASLVVTSRIHCALPCLGLGTPVLFLKKDKTDFVSSCRFGGLSELFNSIQVTEEGLIPGFPVGGKISSKTIINNSDSWKELAKNIEQSCVNFVNCFGE